MPVTSTTINVNGNANFQVYQFSGVVTDADILTASAANPPVFGGAFAARVSANNQVIDLDRTIYIASDCDLRSLRNNYSFLLGTNIQNNIGPNGAGIILHSARNINNTIFRGFTFIQTVVTNVTNRFGIVALWNGSATNTTPAGGGSQSDGLGLNNSAFIFASPGVAPGTGDNRILAEVGFGQLTNAIIGAGATQNNIQPSIGFNTTLNNVRFTRAAGFPQIEFGITTQVNIFVNNSSADTDGSQSIVRAFNNSHICYVNSNVTVNGTATWPATGGSGQFDFFHNGSTVGRNILILSNWQDGAWFGTTNTVFRVANSISADSIIGGTYRRYAFVNSDGTIQTQGTIRAYDGRSTTASVPCRLITDLTTPSFPANFLDSSVSPAIDATTGQIGIVLTTATALGSTPTAFSITRITGQRWVYQRYGQRVIVTTITDNTTGDNLNSPFSPVVVFPQFTTRTQAQVQAATTITTAQQLAEEVHNFAVTAVGAQSYNAPYTGNIARVNGLALEFNLVSLTFNNAFAAKIVYTDATPPALPSLGVRMSTDSSVTGLGVDANITSINNTNATGSIVLTTMPTVVGNYATLAAQTITITTAATLFQSVTARGSITNLLTTGVVANGCTLNVGATSISMTGNLTFTSVNFASGTITLTPGATGRSITLNNCGNITTFPFANATPATLINVIFLGSTVLPATLPTGFQRLQTYIFLFPNTVGIPLTSVRVNKLYQDGAIGQVTNPTLTTDANGITLQLSVDITPRYSYVAIIDGLTPIAFNKPAGSDLTPPMFGGNPIPPQFLDFNQRGNLNAADTAFISGATWTVTATAITIASPGVAYDRSASAPLARMIMRAMIENNAANNLHFAIATLVQAGGVLVADAIQFNLNGLTVNTAWGLTWSKTSNINVVILNLYNINQLLAFRNITTTDTSTQIQFGIFAPGAVAQLTGADLVAIGNLIVPRLNTLSNRVNQASLLIPSDTTPIT